MRNIQITTPFSKFNDIKSNTQLLKALYLDKYKTEENFINLPQYKMSYRLVEKFDLNIRNFPLSFATDWWELVNFSHQTLGFDFNPKVNYFKDILDLVEEFLSLGDVEYWLSDLMDPFKFHYDNVDKDNIDEFINKNAGINTVKFWNKIKS